MNSRRLMASVAIFMTGVFLLFDGPRALFGAEEEKSAKELVYLLDVDGTINPALADYLIKGIEKATEQKAAAVVIRLDTPGGGVPVTKTIIKAIINADVPVVVYVAPSGSSASSAGALITLAADIAAMAPGTNIGAAHPVAIGGQDVPDTMSEKVVNDLTAYLRSIVRERGRNAAWAEKTIRESVSATAEEALQLKAINVVADSVPQLLEKINGMKVEKKGKTITLKTKDAKVERIMTGLRFKILDVIAHPNVAYLLLMGALLGLMIEFYSPGLIFPGVIGGICLLLAGFALHVLPVNYVGILLIILSIVFFILEVKVVSFGMLAVAGVISLTLGSIMLFETEEAAMQVSWSVVIPTVATVSAFFIFVMGLVVRAWMAKPRTGEQGLTGEAGVAVTDLANEGKVLVHGEIWNARSDSVIPKGERVRVIRVDGLWIYVTRQ